MANFPSQCLRFVFIFNIFNQKNHVGGNDAAFVYLGAFEQIQV